MTSHTEIMRCSDDLGEEWSIGISPMVVNESPYYHIMIHGCMFSSLSIVAGHAKYRNVEVASSTGRFIVFRFAPWHEAGMDDSLMVQLKIQETYSADIGGVYYSLAIDSWAISADIPAPSEICRSLLYVLDELCGHLPSFDDL